MGIARDAAVDYADIIDADAEPIGPIHPGVILEEEFLEPLGLSAYALAKAIGVPRNRITGIVRGERAITADTALRLARFFDMSAEFWLGLQMDYDLETTRASIGDRLEQEVSRAPLEARRPTPIPTPVACSPQRARRRSRALAARPVAC